VLHDLRLFWIPIYAVKPLHKTVHKTVDSLDLPWLILHDIRLIWIPIYAVKPLHKTIHETVDSL
ncbi:hypothetical protein K443DRAFT_114216, partial [Laccaria amethystina LaAM-08-1]